MKKMKKMKKMTKEEKENAVTNDAYEKIINDPTMVLESVAWARGYMDRKMDNVSIVSYNGGCTVHKPSWHSTIYHTVEHWVKR